REHLAVEVLDLRLRSELHRVAIAGGSRLAELEGHAAAGADVRRNHADEAVLARELRLDGEEAVRRPLDDQALHGSVVVAPRILVLERWAGFRPEGLPGAGGALRQLEGLARPVRAVRDDFEDGPTGATGERRRPDQGRAASPPLRRALDEALGRIAGRVFHGQRLAEDGLIGGVCEARGERDTAGKRRELRKLSHVVPSLVCRAAGACTARTIRRGERL